MPEWLLDRHPISIVLGILVAIACIFNDISTGPACGLGLLAAVAMDIVLHFTRPKSG